MPTPTNRMETINGILQHLYALGACELPSVESPVQSEPEKPVMVDHSTQVCPTKQSQAVQCDRLWPPVTPSSIRSEFHSRSNSEFPPSKTPRTCIIGVISNFR